MPIIGNPIYQSAFVVDQFSGNGSTVAFTMSVAPAGVTNVLVAVSGVIQDPSTYGVVGNTITFSAAPPSGTGNISVRYLGVPVTGIVTTAYRTVTEFTATASQTTFTPPSYTVGFINVYLNGVLLGSADYTATNGTTVVLATGASAGNLVTVESFRVETVLNAISNSAGSVGTTNIADGAITTAKIASGVTVNFADGSASTPSITNDGDTNTGMFFPAADTIAFSEGGVESMRIDSSGNVGIGTSSPAAKLNVVGGNIRLDNNQGVEWGGGNNYIYGNETTDIVVVATNGTERMRINSSGNVGIGTTSPSYPLDVAGSARGGIVHRQGTYTNGDTNPSVSGVSFLVIANTSPTTINNFTGGVQGQIIYLLFEDSNTTVNRNNAYLNNSTNFVSGSADTLVLIHKTPYWYEISRSVNG